MATCTYFKKCLNRSLLSLDRLLSRHFVQQKAPGHFRKYLYLIVLLFRNLGRLDLQLDWMKAAIRLENNKHRKNVFKAKLSDLKNFHDNLILEEGFWVDQDKYEELSSIEGGTTIVTKTKPELKKYANDPKVSEHQEKLDQIKLELNYNDPKKYFFNINNQVQKCMKCSFFIL